jgi:hypothetical protein
MRGAVMNPQDPANRGLSISMPGRTAQGVNAVPPPGDGTERNAVMVVVMVVVIGAEEWMAGSQALGGAGDDRSATVRNNRQVGECPGTDGKVVPISGSFSCESDRQTSACTGVRRLRILEKLRPGGGRHHPNIAGG